MTHIGPSGLEAEQNAGVFGIDKGLAWGAAEQPVRTVLGMINSFFEF